MIYITTYVILLIIILCWTIKPFLQKIVAKKLNANELMIVNHFVISSIMITYLMYLLYLGKFDSKCIKKLDRTDIIYLLFGALTTVIASLSLLKLLREHDASFIIPSIQPMVIVLTIIIGYFVFKEKVNIIKIVGILSIVLGLLLLNYSNNH